MPITVWQASPPANTFLNLGADIGFGSAVNDFTSPTMHNANFVLGSVSKAITDGILYVMFEINEPVGTSFSSIQFDLYGSLTTGTGFLPFWLGLLAKDGKWNNTKEAFSSGVGNYLTLIEFPQPTAATHANWASGAVSMSDTITEVLADVPKHITFGSVGSGSDYEDDQLLTDFQAAFDANESDRTTTRGVPVMMFMRPNGTVTRSHQFVTQNGLTASQRPTLTLDTTIADLGNIYNVVAKVQQISVTAKPQQADVTALTQQADVTAKPQQADITSKPQQADVTAKPQQADVVAGAEDGND
jgi:hypothetical protein